MSLISDRIAALRVRLAAQGLAAFVVPHADEYQNEYLPPSAERLAYLTGFTGSAGLAIVSTTKAVLFVDGRYTLQAPAETDTAVVEVKPLSATCAADWLTATLPENAVVGFDPWLTNEDSYRALHAALSKKNCQLVPVKDNPVDEIWTDRPAPPLSKAEIHPLEFAGESSEAKRLRMAETLRTEGHQAFILTRPDSLAWLLNLRGADVAHTPLTLGFAVLHVTGTVDLFMAAGKISPEVQAHLGNAVTLHPLAQFVPAIATLAEGSRLVADGSATARAVFALAKDRIERGTDPCQLAKAQKNPTELAGTRNAHRRDGVAMVKCLAWLARDAASGTIDELTVMEKLRAWRSEGKDFRDLSFETIAGSGPNGAIVHYRSAEKTNRRLQPGEFFLLDSGAQYRDGTTDITRTIAVGEVSAEMKDRFTRVLKGHIAIATSVFPNKTTGHQIDAFARRALWTAGVDYDHGTGHGVGSYLSVHEGPQGISTRATGVVLYPGMILSNEPGYYKAGSYGIRIENLVVVEPRTIPGAERDMLGFETVTLCPIDRNAIDPALLTSEERDWLNRYHAEVAAQLVPLLEAPEAAWLKAATAPL
jgi:Xaa-Pro aminopeptidase